MADRAQGRDGFQVFTVPSVFRELRSEETGAVKMRLRTEIFSRVKERKSFRHCASPANSRAHADFAGRGGAAKNLPPRRANRRTHAPVFVGGLPRTPSQLSLRPKAGSVARPPPLKVSFPFIPAVRNEQWEEKGESDRLKGGGRA